MHFDTASTVKTALRAGRSGAGAYITTPAECCTRGVRLVGLGVGLVELGTVRVRGRGRRFCQGVSYTAGTNDDRNAPLMMELEMRALG